MKRTYDSCTALIKSISIKCPNMTVSLILDQWVPEGTCSQVLRSTSVDSKRFRAFKIFNVKLFEICNFVGLLHIPFWLYLVLAIFGITSHIWNFFVWLRITDQGPIPEIRIYDPYYKFNPIWNGVYILVEVSLWISMNSIPKPKTCLITLMIPKPRRRT